MGALKLKRGFTLIEILIVIAIISLLSSIILTALGGSRDHAQDARTRAQVHVYKTFLELYSIDNNTYPPCLDTNGVPMQDDDWCYPNDMYPLLQQYGMNQQQFDSIIWYGRGNANSYILIVYMRTISQCKTGEDYMQANPLNQLSTIPECNF